jgi:hypothetical protein
MYVNGPFDTQPKEFDKWARIMDENAFGFQARQSCIIPTGLF